jgi:hypothetical protein
MGATSKLDMPRGLLIAAIVAWALTWVTDFATTLITLLAAPLFDQAIAVPWDQLATMTGLYAAIGLPLAITVCFAFAWPLWTILDGRGVRGARNAALTGAGFGLALATLWQGVGIFYGWQTALDENAGVNTCAYGFQLISDGLPTPLGWLLNALDAGVTALIGAAASLTAWRYAQPASGAAGAS